MDISWKMMFSDITKQAQEVIFSQPFHPQFYLNKVAVERSFSQKHLGLHRDQKLDFNKLINETNL